MKNDNLFAGQSKDRSFIWKSAFGSTF